MGVNLERRDSRGLSGWELSRCEVRIFQDDTGFGRASMLAMTRTRKLECWAKWERIDVSWERIFSEDVLRRRKTRLR